MLEPLPTTPSFKYFSAQGRWRLLWTCNQSDFARLRRRVRPLPAESVQLIGPPGGLPEGRAANVITVARALTVELSSGGLCAPPPHRMSLLCCTRLLT